MEDPATLFVPIPGSTSPLPGAPPPRAERTRAAILGFLERRQRGPATRGSLASESPRPSPELLLLDGLAIAVARALETLALPLGRAAAAFRDRRAWQPFGYARVDDHARERFGRTGRWLRDQADLGSALERFGPLRQALSGADGRNPLGKVAARLVGTIATADTVEAWIDFARRVTVRELRASVRARCDGSLDGPPDSRTEDRDAKDPVDDRRSIALPVPAAMRLAFDETLRLHRAVSGADTSVTDFVEALVAEAHAGPFPPDAEHAPMRPGLGSRRYEEALARRSHHWARLQRRPRTGSLADLTGDALRRFQAVERLAGRGDAAGLDRQVRELAALEDILERRLGELLLELSRNDAWASLGFAGVRHYGEQRLGLSRTGVERRMRLARSLRRFPRLAEAYTRGRLGIEAALTIVRIIQPWCGRRGSGVHGASLCGAGGGAGEDVDRDIDADTRAETRRTVSLMADPRASDSPGALGGSRPGKTTGSTADSTRGIDVGECIPAGGGNGTGDAAAALECAWIERAAVATIKRLRDEERALKPRARELAPQPLSDADWHASLELRPGQTSSRLRRLGQLAAEGGSFDVFLRLRLPGEHAEGFLAAVESARRRLEQVATASADPSPVESAPGQLEEAAVASRADPSPSVSAAPVAGAPPSVRAAQRYVNARRIVPGWVGLLALLEDFVDTWDDPAAAPRRKSDEIYSRDGWRCSAPGCTSRRNLEDHHVVYRSRGGDRKAARNRVCLCRFHHRRGEHGDSASVRGRAPLGLTWRLGTTRHAVWFRNELSRAPAGATPRSAVSRAHGTRA